MVWRSCSGHAPKDYRFLINKLSISRVQSATYRARYRLPCFSDYCFASIAPAIKQNFGAAVGSGRGSLPRDVFAPPPGGYKHIALLFIDAFGWVFAQKYLEELPFLRRFVERGTVSVVTSQFPSTTSAHITSIHSGLPVAETGIYEWFYYEPLVGEVISPLLFSYCWEDNREGLKKAGRDPHQIFPFQTIYQDLAAIGVTCHIFQNAAYTPSSFSDSLFRGAVVHPYQNFSQALKAFGQGAEGPGPSYSFLYYDAIDSTSHKFGPGSPEVEKAIKDTFIQLEAELQAFVSKKRDDTVLILTADHGQIGIDPSRVVYLDKELPELAAWMEISPGASGRPIVPAGARRDFVLFIKPELLAESQELLTRHLAGVADVVTTDELIAAGVFGGKVSKRFSSRFGNLVVLPHEREAVWWSENGRFATGFRGDHGGLSPQEMETVFMTLEL